MMIPFSPLTLYSKWILVILSFCLVAFGQPTWSPLIGLVSAVIGFALFWRVLLEIPRYSKRFLFSLAWYGSIQAVQLSWMASHPYLYIYGIILFCALLTGTQFGLIGLLIVPRAFSRILYLAAIAGIWVILEWSRLFVLSGLPFNPVGLSLTGSLYALQTASIGGVYLLSFIVFFTNLLALRLTLLPFSWKFFLFFILIVLFPYGYGVAKLYTHESRFEQWNKTHPPLNALLIQTGFPCEECLGFLSAEKLRQLVLDEWRTIIKLISPYQNKKIDLIVLPENVIPFGCYHPVYPLKEVKEIFEQFFESNQLTKLPPLKPPFASSTKKEKNNEWYVTNAFLAQGLANLLNADLVIGLEDSQMMSNKKKEIYSSALHFTPFNLYDAPRYDKRILVPMGEYIPFQWCSDLAAQYGIQGSFTAGKSAEIFEGKVPFSTSICYEEMYGHLMREGRNRGAELLVNLTNDGWFPQSNLPQQHYDHSKLRTVENGVPLVRACNTGVTAGIDSLGRSIAKLENSESPEACGALFISIPTYHYQTFYSYVGDWFILTLSVLFVLAGYFIYNKSRNY